MARIYFQVEIKRSGVPTEKRLHRLTSEGMIDKLTLEEAKRAKRALEEVARREIQGGKGWSITTGYRYRRRLLKSLINSFTIGKGGESLYFITNNHPAYLAVDKGTKTIRSSKQMLFKNKEGRWISTFKVKGQKGKEITRKGLQEFLKSAEERKRNFKDTILKS